MGERAGPAAAGEVPSRETVSLELGLEGRLSRGRSCAAHWWGGSVTVARGEGGCTHRDREDQVRVPGEVRDVPVERDPLLCCASLAHGQGDAQDGIGPKLG